MARYRVMLFLQLDLQEHVSRGDFSCSCNERQKLRSSAKIVTTCDDYFIRMKQNQTVIEKAVSSDRCIR